MKNYQVPFLIKRKKSKVFLGVFLICFFSLFACSVFVSVLKIFGAGKNQTTDFFVVMLNSNLSSKLEASEQAQTFKTRGGAGVLFFDKTFFVAISVYQNKADASKIAQNLTTETQQFVVEKFEQKFSESKQNSEFAKFLNSLLMSFYDISVELEKGTKTPVLANLALRNLLTQTTLKHEQAMQVGEEFFSNIFLNAKSVLEYATSIDVLNTSLLPYVSVVRAGEIQILSTFANHRFQNYNN